VQLSPVVVTWDDEGVETTSIGWLQDANKKRRSIVLMTEYSATDAPMFTEIPVESVTKVTLLF